MFKEALFENGVTLDCYSPADAAISKMTFQTFGKDYYWHEFNNNGVRLARFWVDEETLNEFPKLKQSIEENLKKPEGIRGQYHYEVEKVFYWIGK